MKTRRSMTEMVEEYLEVRRVLGVQLRIEGRQLLAFARFADDSRHRGPITIDLVVRWARSSPKSTRAGCARRVDTVRPFARYRFAFDACTEIPPSHLLGPARTRRPPHVYSTTETRDMLTAAGRLYPVGGVRPATVRTVLGLLACTGMRPAEAIRLTESDADLSAGVLTIRETKFCKSRLVPLHPTATRALRRYKAFRDRTVPVAIAPTFFVVDGGIPFSKSKLRTAFLRIRRELGWTASGAERKPRIYDLRHAFATRRLLRWHADGIDVHVALPSLSTYLGHVKVSDTYWYLSAIPELMAITAGRFEQFVVGDRP